MSRRKKASDSSSPTKERPPQERPLEECLLRRGETCRGIHSRNKDLDPKILGRLDPYARGEKRDKRKP